MNHLPLALIRVFEESLSATNSVHAQETDAQSTGCAGGDTLCCSSDDRSTEGDATKHV
jgi:hypothetical protein